MPLPFEAPVKPMLAKLVREIPADGDHLFEPKWDGFRALVFRDGDDVRLQSRELRPLERYFPELIAPLKEALSDRAVIDGEIVVATAGGLDFSTLQLRLHPAASRIRKLSEQTPASFVAFDILAEGDEDLRPLGTAARRKRLETMLSNARRPIHLTPVTRDAKEAADWFDRFEGAGLDGVMAKPADLPYQPAKRAMLKVKHRRTADCVIAGFRWHKDGPGTLVGSLLLGIYDDDGRLQHVGVTSSFKKAERAQLVETLAPLREGALDDHPWSSWAKA
ncbi:MAG: ATP-dependent DNA ligase, partial [Myxococcota bacterium]